LIMAVGMNTRIIDYYKRVGLHLHTINWISRSAFRAWNFERRQHSSTLNLLSTRCLQTCVSNDYMRRNSIALIHYTYFWSHISANIDMYNFAATFIISRQLGITLLQSTPSCFIFRTPKNYIFFITDCISMNTQIGKKS
jgi:hypothetical protein